MIGSLIIGDWDLLLSLYVTVEVESVWWDDNIDSSLSILSSLSFSLNIVQSLLLLDISLCFTWWDWDDDIELLDLTGEEQKDEVQIVENEIIEEKITTVEEAEDAIKRIIKKAIDNNVALEMEEFNFDKMYQFVIRLDKDEKETN